MHLPGGGGIIVPCDVISVKRIGDLDPFNALIQKDSGPLFVRTGFAHQNLDCNTGVKQHFDLVRNNVDQRVCGRQAGEHGQYGDLHTIFAPFFL